MFLLVKKIKKWNNRKYLKTFYTSRWTWTQQNHWKCWRKTCLWLVSVILEIILCKLYMTNILICKFCSRCHWTPSLSCWFWDLENVMYLENVRVPSYRFCHNEILWLINKGFWLCSNNILCWYLSCSVIWSSEMDAIVWSFPINTETHWSSYLDMTLVVVCASILKTEHNKLYDRFTLH